MRKNILVTGSKGFIGKKLVKKLKIEHNVFELSSSLGDDVCDEKSFDKFIKERIDTVFHLAAKNFVPDSWDNPNVFYKTNVIGTQNALDFCKKTNASMVYLSSYCYGNPEYLPIDELHPIKLPNPYAHSKKMAEDLCEFYAKEMGINASSLRVFNVYGEGQSEYFLIPEIIKQAKTKDVITVKNLRPKRDYVYVEDVIDACCKCVDCDGYNIYNIGSSESYSVEEVIKMAQDATSRTFSYDSTEEYRQNEIMNTVADISKAKSLLGWEPKKKLREFVFEQLKDF